MTLDISVVIPTFRRPAELAQTLASVLAQRDVSLEIIVVDDSPEGSAEPVAAAAADPRITYMRNPEPSGGRPGAVRNVGWPRASGTLVHFLDDDDLVPDGHYATSVREFDRLPTAGVAFGRIEPFGDESRVPHERTYFTRAAKHARFCRRFGKRWAFAAQMFFAETMLVCGAAMIRRDCVTALGGFDAQLKLMEDVDFYARALRRFGTRFVDRVTLQYRIGPSLMRQGGIDEEVLRSYRRMHARYRADYGWLDFTALKATSTLLHLAT